MISQAAGRDPEQAEGRGGCARSSASRSRASRASRSSTPTRSACGSSRGRASILTAPRASSPRSGKSSELRAALYGKKKAALDFDILSTHPSTPDRVAKAVAAARQIGAPGIGTRDRATAISPRSTASLLATIPLEGFVRGRKFTHPRLRFTFTAPEGFPARKFQRGGVRRAQADNEALRLDSVRSASARVAGSLCRARAGSTGCCRRR